MEAVDIQTNVASTQSESEKKDVMNDSSYFNYFNHCNQLCKGIIDEQRSLTKFLGERWQELNSERKDSLLDLLFVEDFERQTASCINSNPIKTCHEQIQESFPRLFINSGQKINVDYESDLWTWRDEHSGPFSWMSRSQQDLTLVDLEPENITKPQPKALRNDLDNEENIKEAEKQFTYPANCWSRDVIDDYRKSERSIVLSPCSSLEFTDACVRHENGANKETIGGFETPEMKDHCRAESEEREEDVSQKRKNSGKERKKRSPSPKKLLRSGSLRKSPSKTVDGGEQQLISRKEDDNYEERNAFSNPLVETHWSAFVGESPGESCSDVHNPPMRQVMDRGEDILGRSPYQVKKDSVCLITPEESPSQSSKMYTASNDLGSSSIESTPDHTTHLLKKKESDSRMVKPEIHCDHPQPSQTLPASNYLEEEEILTVEEVGADFKISTQPEPESKRDSNIPTTGFDFLDNW